MVVPKGVTSIRDRAFFRCEGFTGIMLPEDLADIGKDAFTGCENLTDIKCSYAVYKKLKKFQEKIMMYFIAHMSDYSADEQKAYIKYIKANRAKAAGIVIEKADVKALNDFLEIFIGTKTDIWSECLELTEKYSRTELNAYILESKNRALSE